MLEVSRDHVLQSLSQVGPHQGDYYAIYSNLWGGWHSDSALFTLPIDDHMVHRGDGVFEVIKVTSGRVYALEPHLRRLQESMGQIGLKAPAEDVRSVVMHTARYGLNKAGVCEALIRIFCGRGPGGFTTNPYESVKTSLYVVITRLKSPSPRALESGVSMGLSQIPIKPGFFARVKSCNYLPNVLMKKEALDRGLDYTLALDERGHVAEGSTENVGVVTRDNVLVVPSFDRTLQGVTATRVLELAEKRVQAGLLAGVENRDLRLSELQQAREIHVYGTTIDVLSVREFEGRTLSSREHALALRKALLQDQLDGENSVALPP